MGTNLSPPFYFPKLCYYIKYMIIKTPSGYEVEIKDKLNFGETRKLQKSFFQDTKLEFYTDKTGERKVKMPEFDMAKILEYTERSIPLLVSKITKGDVVITENLMAEIDSWSSEDGQAVFEQVTNLAQELMGGADDKKKVEV